MSNATTLQTNNNKISTNNTDLVSILNTINNLPEAGATPTGELTITENGTFDVTNYASALVNVAGSGGELQYVTGTITRTTIDDITSGTTFFSVRGLGFVPKFVYIGWAVLGGSMAYTSNRKDSYWFVGAMGGLKTMDIEVRRSASAYAYLYSNNGSYPKATVNLNNDGFEVVANDKIVLYTGEYQYIAIG